MSHLSVLVVAAVLHRDGRFLICRRPLEKRHGGLWELPGGKVQPGESAADALRRELDEELDLTLTSVGEPLAELADPGSEFMIRFLPAEAVGEPVAREHLALAWVTVEEAGGYALAPGDRRFVEGWGFAGAGGVHGRSEGRS